MLRWGRIGKCTGVLLPTQEHGHLWGCGHKDAAVTASFPGAYSPAKLGPKLVVAILNALGEPEAALS